MKIIVIEDHASTLNAIRVGLISCGHRVLTAQSAGQALSLLQRGKKGAGQIDLMVTDLSMRGIDGLDLVIKARAIHPELFVIIMTAYGDDPHTVRRMKSAKRLWLLGKPFGTHELNRVIGEIVDDLKRTIMFGHTYRKVSYA